MMEMQAVIGRIQLRRMSEWTQKRYENAQQLLMYLRSLLTLQSMNLR